MSTYKKWARVSDERATHQKARNLHATAPIVKKGGAHTNLKNNPKRQRKEFKLTLKQYLSTY